MDDRPAQGQRVTRRARRRRHDDAVGVELARRLVIYQGLDPDQVDLAAFVHDDVVERIENPLANPRLEQRPALQLEVAGGPPVERLPFVAQLHLGEEPEATGVDPEHGDVGRRRLLGGP